MIYPDIAKQVPINGSHRPGLEARCMFCFEERGGYSRCYNFSTLCCFHVLVLSLVFAYMETFRMVFEGHELLTTGRHGALVIESPRPSLWAQNDGGKLRPHAPTNRTYYIGVCVCGYITSFDVNVSLL